MVGDVAAGVGRDEQHPGMKVADRDLVPVLDRVGDARNARRVRQAVEKYGRDIRVRWYTPDNYSVVECLGGGLTMAKLKAEFNLAARGEYMEHCTRVQRANMT